MKCCSGFWFVPFNHLHYDRLPLGVLRSVEAATELSGYCSTSIKSTDAEEIGIGCVLLSIDGIIPAGSAAS